MIPKSNHHFGYFFIQMWPCEVQLLGFLQGPKRNFVNSNANILQSTWSKILKLLLHLFKIVYYKILELHVLKNDFISKIWYFCLIWQFSSIFGKNIVKELKRLMKYKMNQLLKFFDYIFSKKHSKWVVLMEKAHQKWEIKSCCV